jgi:hypothetical protein
VREGKGGTGTYNARPATTNLMIHGDVGTGQNIYDSSPSKHAITVNGNTTHSTTQSKFSGGSIYFDGAGDYLTTASTDAADFGTGDWTVDYWFNMTNGQTDRMHSLSLGTYTGCGGGSNIDFNFNDGNAFWLYWNGCGSPNIIFGSDGDYGDGAWHHMAVTRESGTVRVWVDGVHKGSNAYSSSTSMGSTDTIEIGYGYYWDGYLDEVRITKGTALWVGSGNFTPPTRRNLSAPVVDRSGSDNGGNFTTKAMTDVATFRDGQVIEPVASAVWDFDGTDDYIICGNGSSLNFGTGDFTIGFWVNITGWVSSWAWPVSKNSGYVGMFIALTSPGYFRASLGAWFTDVIGSYSSEPAISFGTWYHFTLRRASGSVTAYLNGNQYGTSVANTYDLGTQSTQDLNIGLGPAASSLTNGRFGAVQVYKTALTAQQVKENFNQQRNRFKI